MSEALVSLRDMSLPFKGVKALASDGERQMVAVGRALATAPRIAVSGRAIHRAPRDDIRNVYSGNRAAA